ncbi:D-glycero-beta-D-manno-heptose-7-phosphate kinase [Sphingomonas prati]|uniref:Bifunctional protein HldE n=1 Tax=Sphingomonas prati TaxID=1843237 RepID=A0A7W9BTW5_9SPHN|nr:D-glycero-beta-D-manno-heptose-7-phosphate kinase [Sphingomonas prati]MBB5729849.1 D-beta-D-heptose 7-phosphate kinase/D-beta-D-heptose 1-phosphate adenosyltransferase [Sphingomonas prati]GGE89037.1 bifunctional protein HldE [Sphingomonas prati]
MQTLLDLFTNCKIAVVGDVMLDCYITGDVNRISPEAPVPVVRARSERMVPGGAANVAANLAALDVHVRLVGITGEDVARDQLIAKLCGMGDIECGGLVAAGDRRTTQKLRIIGAHQQIVRIDHEDVGIDDPALDEVCIAAARTAIDAADVVILSDYNKGVCSDRLVRAVIDHANAAGKPVLIDPKRRDLTVYRGASILTPNRKELSDATGLPCETDEEAAAAVAQAQAACGAAVLLTRSEKGMSFYPVDGTPSHMATVAQDVFDVSGAGDTVMAVLAASIAADLPIAEGMRLANHAAGIVVSHMGTATVTRDELIASLAADTVSASVNDGRFVDLDGAVALRWSWAKEKLTVGFANGCFDLLHPGHVSLIRQAAAGCDRLIMALNTDDSVRRLKGPTRPIQDEAARAAVMGAIKGVSAVVLFGEDTPLELITALQPDIIVKGSDYTEDQVVGADIVKARGGRVILIDLSKGHSTSRIVAAAQAE